MQQYQTLLARPHQIVPPCFGATDSIGTVNDSVPVHPEDRHPSFDDFKQKRKPKPSAEQPPEKTDNKPTDTDHQIDEYA
jgi:hypothetical protein